MSDECDCGFCGKCKENSEWELENERRSDNCSYDRKRDDEPKESEHYYWRL